MSTLAATLFVVSTSFLAAPQKTGPTVTVAPDGSGDHTTIQAAVDAAPEGAVVSIAAGEYAERVVVSKPLTLEGPGWKRGVLTAPYVNALADDPSIIGDAMAGITSREQQRAVRERLTREYAPKATLHVEGTSGVRITGLKISQPGKCIEGQFQPGAAVTIETAQARLEDCAVVGSPAGGITVVGASDVVIRACLVAGVGATGIATGGRPDQAPPRISIEDCELRNCVYAGIRVARTSEATIAECRISGASWHGIRYDDASPTILGNLIFDNARSGIYASGATAAVVRDNVFYRNRMTGMSCWLQNADTIEGNTFMGNVRSGLEVLGASTPSVHGNAFVQEQTGVRLGDIGGEEDEAAEHVTSTGVVDLRDNLFWEVEQRAVRAGEPLAAAEADGNREQDPGVAPPSLESRWPAQPEEAGLGVPPIEVARSKAEARELQAAAWQRGQTWVDDIMQIGDAALRDRTVETVRGALASSDPVERMAGLIAFVRTAEASYDRASFRPLVRPLVETETGYGQVQALYALLNSERGPGDCELMVELLKDPSPSLRASGSHLLAMACEMDISGPAAEAALRLLDTDAGGELREAMRGLWGVRASDEVQARLLEIAAGPSRHDAIYYGLSTLRNKNPDTVAFLIEVLEDRDHNDSARALSGLTNGVAEQAQPAAADAALLLFEARAHTREDCLRILSNYADASHLEAMRVLADNELLTEDMREQVRQTIGTVEARL